MTKDQSFGIIIFSINQDGNREYLLINQKSQNGNFWWFPKWHPEIWETPVQTARRECLEEVWINRIDIIEWKNFEICYSFPTEHGDIEKSVVFFVWQTDQKDVKIQPEELNGYKWADFDTALSLLTHKNSQNLLIETNEFLW